MVKSGFLENLQLNKWLLEKEMQFIFKKKFATHVLCLVSCTYFKLVKTTNNFGFNAVVILYFAVMYYFKFIYFLCYFGMGCIFSNFSFVYMVTYLGEYVIFLLKGYGSFFFLISQSLVFLLTIYVFLSVKQYI